MNIVMVALGGALGSTGRYLLGLALKGVSFWAGTLLVNLLGCFILGYLVARGLPEDEQRRLLYLALTTGVMGGFTTFSTFAVDAIRLVEREQLMHAAIYVTVSAVGGVILAGLGHNLGKAI